jgi:hypothetical protein
MECVPSNRGYNDWYGLSALDIIDQLSRVRIALMADFVGIGVEKGPNCRLEVVDMFVGPFNFEANKSEPFVWGHDMLSG